VNITRVALYAGACLFPGWQPLQLCLVCKFLLKGLDLIEIVVMWKSKRTFSIFIGALKYEQMAGTIDRIQGANFPGAAMFSGLCTSASEACLETLYRTELSSS
jgi:hypothetical protein